jgi:hypothetical protein
MLTKLQIWVFKVDKNIAEYSKNSSEQLKTNFSGGVPYEKRDRNSINCLLNSYAPPIVILSVSRSSEVCLLNI